MEKTYITFRSAKVFICCSEKSYNKMTEKEKFPIFTALRYVKYILSFRGFQNFCFQFGSFGCFYFGGVLIFSNLQLESRFSRIESLPIGSQLSSFLDASAA